MVYRRYASLFFVTGITSSDNELVTLEIIHRYVEVLDRYFGNVSGNSFPAYGPHSTECCRSASWICERDGFSIRAFTQTICRIFNFQKAYAVRRHDV